MAKAKAAGLLDGDAQYDNDMIADAATTVFTVTAGGQTSTVRAYALELDPMLGPNVDEPLAEAREKLATFRDEVTDIESWIAPNMIVEPAHDYEIERMQIAILPADSPSAPQIEEGLEAQTIDWPLMTPLSSFGTPYFTDEYRCGVVEGEDLATLLPLLREANQLTRWVSTDETTGEEEEYIFFLRPLFPGEQPCTAPAF